MKYRYKSVSIVPGVRTMQKLFPDYPCGRRALGCIRSSAPGRCAKICDKWQLWFHNHWEAVSKHRK